MECDLDLVAALDELDDRSFVSLCFGPSVSVRTWLLNNAERFQVRPSVLFTVFLGFTKDPYPYVRKAALDGLASLRNTIFEEHDMITGCYSRAIELLNDEEDCVRSAAIRVVITWGLMLGAYSPERKQLLSDEMFINLCSMTRDMSMKVRVEAFDAMKRLEMVSEDILLQSLSKRVLGFAKGKKPLVQCAAEQFEAFASDVAGAFVHGVEDEFHEVRKSALDALSNLTVLSTQFAGEALHLLMDVLNDDSISVRLQALETIHHMAISNCLKLQEAHMHMFLSASIDKNSRVRSALRKILRLIKLPDLETFKLSFNGLLESLESYPQDESDVLSVIFHMGRNHGNMVISIIQEVSQQIDPSAFGKHGFNSVRVAAFIVLAISAPTVDGRVCGIAPKIFSYALSMLGRISRALADVMDQSTLFAYLLHNGKNIGTSDKGFNPEGTLCPPTVRSSSNEIVASIQTPAVIIDQQNRHNDNTESIKAILSRVQDTWPLIQSELLNEVLRTLRFCKEALAAFTSQADRSDGALAFTSQYRKIIKLLAKVWIFMSTKKNHLRRVGEIRLLLGKLETRLKELRSVFIGFSEKDEIHILELMLLTYTFRLSNGEVCCHPSTLKKLSILASNIDHLLKERSVEPSSFVSEIQTALSNLDTIGHKAYCHSFDFKKLLNSFNLNQLELSVRLKHIKADLIIPDNDYEKPLFFVPGLPVGIPCQIVLHNVISQTKLWLKITVDNVTSQYIFLDFNQFGGCDDEVIEFNYVAPFYRTPKASSFIATICLGVECWFEDDEDNRRRGGPKRDLAYICKQKEVYLCMVQTKGTD